MNSVERLEYPPRRELSRLANREVSCEATFTGDSRVRNGKRLYLLRHVFVFPRLTLDHLYVELDNHARRQIKAGSRFGFRATVMRYHRADGTEDFSLDDVRVTR